MERFAHYLSRNHASQIPSNCIWFDTETKSTLDDQKRSVQHLWFGYACYQRRASELVWEPEQWLRFDSIHPFWEWVVSRCRAKTRLYLFCHNGAFDLPVMDAFAQLPKHGFRLTSAVADAPPLILTWKRGGKGCPEYKALREQLGASVKPKPTETIKFVDTLNIWRLPLNSIGASIGLKKLAMPKLTDPQAQWEAYGKRDVEVLQSVTKAWFTFIRDNDLGGFSPTLASQAFNAYRHRFMKHPIFVDANTKAVDLARESYVGGRVECFRLGRYHGQFYYIDVNSMYPSVMVNQDFPCRLVSVYQRPRNDEIKHWLKDKCMVVDCEIDTPDPAYPVIMNNKLMFPIGQFRVNLATPEFKYAFDNGHITKMHQLALYEKASLFKDFITEIYTLRLAAKERGDDINAWLYKILMNSLYGKFGQRGRVYETCDTCDPKEIWSHPVVNMDTGVRTNMRAFGGIVQHQLMDGESRESHPAIASHVTSAARMILWRAIAKAGREHVYYCDTDSLVVDSVGFDNMSKLIDDSKLGYWALERTLSEIVIHGCKDYEFDDIVRTKGVRSSALWIAPNRVLQDQFLGLAALLKEGQLKAPIVRSQIKTLKRVYDKARVYPSGDTTPWCLPNDLPVN